MGSLGLGSIPARAGEPPGCRHRRLQHRVYPRACGGTELRSRHEIRDGGLSPRVRGNRRRRSAGVCQLGSIPARAGEPEAPAVIVHGHRVYPRACGGTGSRPNDQYVDEDLSPRVRGNRLRTRPSLDRPGSIPARAGEPATGSTWTDTSWVYPRACGGTPGWNELPVGSMGLSPRVRGNQHANQLRLHSMRSIPARAGEP